ncbi:hypothetical protein M758_UG162000 [Ceratodon purpureus]|nr:hypothetical protein M758_UG162000 [Ceratodon purpureus]
MCSVGCLGVLLRRCSALAVASAFCSVGASSASSLPFQGIIEIRGLGNLPGYVEARSGELCCRCGCHGWSLVYFTLLHSVSAALFAAMLKAVVLYIPQAGGDRGWASLFLNLQG